MNFYIAAGTDIGNRKKVNQDSLFARVLRVKGKRMAFAVICDGMGGYAFGEVASASLIRAFTDWMWSPGKWHENGAVNFKAVEAQWIELILKQNKMIREYGGNKGEKTGTTATSLLIADGLYIILSVGDTRVYEIKDSAKQITKDQTFVQREVDLGRITPEQARTHPRQNVLLQCVGILENVDAVLWSGEAKKDAVYMLCSDGFRHVVSNEEIFNCFQPERMADEDAMSRSLNYLIELNKSRGEGDNISAAAIKTF
jgi:serine/threonine protein phosphatase PrpC